MNIRTRRKAIGMSQITLAQAVGLTFQQIQKYERGLNRVSASKLFEVSRALGVPVSFFFDGLVQSPGEEGAESSALALLATAEGAEMATYFPKLPPATRKSIAAVVRAIVIDREAEDA
jgi:transcriptional regulator with XRE-family HTH domain